MINGTGLVVIAVLVLDARSAYAYIDPGTMSIVLQATVGGIATIIVAFRKRAASLLSLFRRSLRRGDACTDALDDVDDGAKADSDTGGRD